MSAYGQIWNGFPQFALQPLELPAPVAPCEALYEHSELTRDLAVLHASILSSKRPLVVLLELFELAARDGLLTGLILGSYATIGVLLTDDQPARERVLAGLALYGEREVATVGLLRQALGLQRRWASGRTPGSFVFQRRGQLALLGQQAQQLGAYRFASQLLLLTSPTARAHSRGCAFERALIGRLTPGSGVPAQLLRPH